MLRSAASRGVLRSLNPVYAPAFRTATSPITRQSRSQLCTISQRPQALSMAKPLVPKTPALVRWATGDRKPIDAINKREETELGKQRLDTSPERVSADSSTHPVMSEVGVANAARKTNDDEGDSDMLAGVRSDLDTIRETFSLKEVPKEAYYMGMAGVLPYAATSLSTIYCAWEINHAAETGMGLLMSGKSAELLLNVIEPIQVGYGAVILSFLGAIHWGLEWANYGGRHGYPRYAIGVVATAAAWPTLLLPVEYALISQFLVFNFLYYTDSRATKRGWAPAWYAVYRFVLTFVVGTSIVVSLIGRGHIRDPIGNVPGPTDKIRQLRDSQSEQLEEEEEARRKYLADKDEDEEEEGEGEEESEDGDSDEKEQDGGDEKKEEGGDEKEGKEDDGKDEKK